MAYVESVTGWLYVMDFDGENRRQITTRFTGELVWSPDGSRILYARYDSLYIADADGSNQQQLAANTGGELSYSWSPDGSKISYSCEDGLFTVEGDGANLQRVADGPIVEAVWSPNGAKIFYSLAGNLARWDNYEIYTVDANGENSFLITSNYYRLDDVPLMWLSNEKVFFNQGGALCTARFDGQDWEPFDEDVNTGIFSTSSYQQQYVYELRVENNMDIYICDADGQNEVRLTKHDAEDESPKWVTLDLGTQAAEQQTR